MLLAMQRVVDALLMPAPARLPELRASAQPLLEPTLQQDPGRFFAFAEPPRPLRVASHGRRRLRGGEVVARELEIAYRPYLAAGADQGDAREERILLEHWVHRRRPARGTLLALHGFAMGWPRFDAVALLAAQWYRLGLDVALPTLPHHGRRTPAGSHFSGEAFAVPHVARLAEAVRQAVYELLLLQRWLRQRNPGPLGVLGLSLGGYLAALLAGLRDDLDFVVPMASPVCMGDLAWRFFQRSRRSTAALQPAFTREELRVAFRVHSPLAHPLRVPRERLLVVAGRGDRIVPPEHPHALCEHWGRPAMHWFSGGHLTPFSRPRIVRAVRDHLRALGIV